MSEIYRVKPGGLIEKILLQKTQEKRICAMCNNLIKVSDTAFGCIAHDKLIVPEYLPYHGNYDKCKDWIAVETNT